MLGKIMVDATRAAELEARQKGIAFVTHYDPEIAICVDPGLTTSALQNVVDNAVKFTDRGRIEITADNNLSEVLIHVYDNCDGLSGEELKTIFEPFKRAHSGKAGTGLGLSIARRALEAQGGQIGAEPGGERGCHFWLTLPKPRH
jgi:signal transduction histidine kinase